MSGELAGRLRERVTVERCTPARDALGGATGAWETRGTHAAWIRPRGIGPLIVGEAPDAPIRWQVVVRAGSRVSVGDRLLWDGRTLAVRAVIDDPTTPDRTRIDAEEQR